MNEIRNKVKITLGEPTVIFRGAEFSKVGWGPTQFPRIEPTNNGLIIVHWNETQDSLESITDTPGFAVSEDGGATWRSKKSSEKLMGQVVMSNGKYFHGFTPENAVAVDFLDKYTPVYSFPTGWDGIKDIYNASEIKELSNVITASEYDPETDEYTYFDSTINWPNRPVSSFRKFAGKIKPLSLSMAYGGNATAIRIGTDIYIAVGATGLVPETGEPTKYKTGSIYVFKTSDCARTWDYVSYVEVTENVLNDDPKKFDGFCEPKMNVMPDGSVIMIMRSGRNIPSFIVRSTDNCKTWSKPEYFDCLGVWPQITTLGCGITLATYGRHGIRLKATTDPSGIVWDDSIIMPLTEDCNDCTCAYTWHYVIDDNTILMAYSDLYYPDENGVERKTILVRTVRVDAD